MNNADLKSANSVKIGIVFSDARASIGLTIIEVSEKTLINLKYIEAIESGDYSDFPSEGFARAYFIKYANFLAIKCDFPSIYDANTRKVEIVKKSLPTLNKPFFNLFAAGLLILIVIIIILISSFSNKNLEAMDIKNIKINPSEQNISIIVETVKNNIISSQNERTKVTQAEPLRISNEMELLFNKECWIEIHSNDLEIVSKLFNSGDKFKIVIERPFKIVIGNADAISGTYNGNIIDFISNANRLRVNTIIFNDE